MKTELKGKIIGEFVGLESRMYSLVSVDGEEVKKTKRANKSVVKNIRHKKFVDPLLDKKWWDITWKELKLRFVRFLCLVLMIIHKY